MVISLYKSSLRGYRLLQKIFALPSRRTLADMLKKIPFMLGVNQQV